MQTLHTLLAEPIIPVVAGLMALVLVLLLILVNAAKKQNRLRNRENRAILDEKVNETREKELEWYREKRFLMERQAREKQERLASLVDFMSPEKSHRLSHPASRLFFLAETIREERQYLGTDISKLAMIDRRLRDLGKEFILQSGKGAKVEKWLSEMSLCRQMLQSNLEDLRKSQNVLRNTLSGVVNLEEKAIKNAISDAEIPQALSILQETRRKLAELPDGLRTVAKSTGEKAQTLFREAALHLPDKELHDLWRQQMDLDLFSSKHRTGGRSDLLAAATAAISALHAISVSVPEGAASFWKENLPKEEKKTKADPFGNAELIPTSGGFATGETKPETVAETAPVTSAPVHPILSERESIEKEREAKVEGTTGIFAILSSAAAAGGTVLLDREGNSPEKNGVGRSIETKEEPATDPVSIEWSRNWHRRILEASAKTRLTEKKSDEPRSEEKPWSSPTELRLSHTDPKETAKKKIVFNPFSPPDFDESGTAAPTESKKESLSSPGKQVSESSSLVIFRSSKPEIWNSTCNNGENERSIAFDEISGKARWLGIKRLDTGDEVFSEITLQELKSDGSGRCSGFNGSNEYFYGARHLGFFSEECSTEVETRFTFGGWGFGHLSAASESEAQKQICGWNGKRIPDETIFEFTLYEDRPSHCREDQIVV